MRPRDFNKKGGKAPPLEDRQRQAATAKEATLANYKRKAADLQERRDREREAALARPTWNTDRYREALARVPFTQLDRQELLHPSAAYEQLSLIALEAINENSRRAVLCWPRFARSPAAVVAMLALADCAACDPIEYGGYKALSAPRGLRALIYPYARTAHRALRHIYVDRNYVHEIQLKHQIRCGRPEEDPALADFHKTLARVHKLTGKTSDGEDYPEFANPCLDELLPSGPCSGSNGRSELLWRVRTKTDLKDIKRTGAADDPAIAQFYLFGIWANDDSDARLRALRAPPTLVFLQLDSVGRSRLGRHWEARAKSFLESLYSLYGDVPVVALTDDPWTFDRLRFDTLSSKPRKRRDAPCASNVIFARESEITTAAPSEPVEYAPIKDCQVIAYAGEIPGLLRRLRSNRLQAVQAGDDENAERIGIIIGVIRRCASLPGSRAEFARFIEEESGPIAAAELLVPYRVGILTKELRESVGAWPQRARAELESMIVAIQEVWNRTESITPMKPLLRDLMPHFLRNSSRSVFLFPNDLLADFAAHVLETDDEIGTRVAERIEIGMVRFLDRHGLEDLEELPKPERNYTKTMVVVAPSRAAMLDLLARPWLPENVIILSDADTLEASSRDTSRLSKYAELSALKLRFEAFTAKASEAVQRVRGVAVALDPETEPDDDVDLPSNRIINLAGKVRENQPLLRVSLDSGHGGGQVVMARPGTRLVVQDKSQVLPSYKEVEASSIEEGDRICVIGDAFVEMARPLVNITKRAAEEIRDYHDQVAKRFAQIPGDSVQARLRTLVGRMNIEGVTPQRAHYWIDLDEQLQASLDDVVPSAPRDKTTFVAFMRALGLTGPVVDRYWTWAVIAQRSHKLQAGMGIRDAYRGILVDAYSAQADNPDRVRELRRLRAAAENFVGVVRKIESARAENAGT